MTAERSRNADEARHGEREQQARHGEHDGELEQREADAAMAACAQSNLDGAPSAASFCFARHSFALDRLAPMRPTRLSLLAARRDRCLAACANPRTEANVAQALNDAANEISGLKNDIAELQTQMDSLRTDR